MAAEIALLIDKRLEIKLELEVRIRDLTIIAYVKHINRLGIYF